jgi:hypothetical protein
MSIRISLITVGYKSRFRFKKSGEVRLCFYEIRRRLKIREKNFNFGFFVRSVCGEIRR